MTGLDFRNIFKIALGGRGHTCLPDRRAEIAYVAGALPDVAEFGDPSAPICGRISREASTGVGMARREFAWNVKITRMSWVRFPC